MTTSLAKARAIGLALLAALPHPSFTQEPSPLGEEEVSSAAPIFLAPFTTADFLTAAAQEVHLRRIASERATGIYLDSKTGLIWMARDNAMDIDWRRANQYCEDLELADFHDWRLPTLDELQGILKPLSWGKVYSTPDLIELTACCPWSSTKKDEVAAWNFNFKFKKPFAGSMTHTYDLRALCVRVYREEDGWIPEPPE